MRLRKIYSMGVVYNQELYERLKKLDEVTFYGCGNEFKTNREWWVMVDNETIVAYCGCLYSEDNICIFVRAWVHKPYRGLGFQRRMIDCRIRNAIAKGCSHVITYTLHNNVPSANNLIKRGFYLYKPEYAYAGRDVLYFKKKIA